jgi:hypothetical protein
MKPFTLPICSTTLRRLPPALVAAALSLWLGGVGLSLLAVPVIRSATSSESDPAKERNEEATSVARLNCDRRSFAEGRRAANVIGEVRPDRLAFLHRLILEIAIPPGHRLSNGLLAPLTC